MRYYNEIDVRTKTTQEKRNKHTQKKELRMLYHKHAAIAVNIEWDF